MGALEYYDDALALWPENCDAMGYKTELYTETSNRTKALETLTTLCQTCGVQESATEAALSSYTTMYAEEDVYENCLAMSPPSSAVALRKGWWASYLAAGAAFI